MFKKTYLENGIPVVMEQIKNVRSVALGIWVRVGSRNEPAEKNGISHFLEHMFFKGTQKRSAKDIAIDTDSIGGDLNAFTSRESTTFYIKVLDEYFEKGNELLSDIFLHSAFPENDVEKEKGIIKEEIKMVEDTPDDYIYDLFNLAIWGDEGIGQAVLGKRSTIKTFKREDLLSHIKKYYGIKDTVMACAGNFEFDKLIDMLNHSFGSLRRGSEPEKGKAPVFNNKVTVHNKELSEAHICIGVEGIPVASDDRYVLFLLNTILGAGVSSRLFQEIREKRGLVYSIYSYISAYLDTGVWAVYAGTGRKRVAQVMELIVKEMRELADNMTEIELERAKAQLKGNLILGLESTSSRMQNIARQEIYYGRYYSPSELIKDINAVDLKRVKELSKRLMSQNAFAVTVLGPVNEVDIKGIAD
ncbi:MAG: pitrilysin family protein [Thermodesulfovibrionales bacterium]|nr:pitrilysin family protein [Thermodesulfovibrionales bacterium]MDP3111256.1 pitrilysin family protein [Thermodesulfovibrionales bacterium]